MLLSEALGALHVFFRAVHHLTLSRNVSPGRNVILGGQCDGQNARGFPNCSISQQILRYWLRIDLRSPLVCSLIFIFLREAAIALSMRRGNTL